MALGRLLGRRATDETAPQQRAVHLHPIKLRAMESAVERVKATSFVDCGAVWVVEGGYTFHALELPGIEGGTLVDTGITDVVRRKAAAYPTLRLLEGNFGEKAMADRVGPVDVVLFNDVLLHQVNPDWDDVLRVYARHAKAIVVVQPMWTGPETVRLLDLGKDTYLANVPPEQIEIDFDNLHAIHPRYNRPVRDIHEIWQWGNTDADLRRTMADLGFRLTYWEHGGQWRMLEGFDNIAYVFVRD